MICATKVRQFAKISLILCHKNENIMIQELQLRVHPRTASSNSELVRHLDKYNDIPADSIQGIRILKRSIDARQRNVVVNLKVRVYINEPMTQDYLVPPIDYKPVDGRRQAIVVGMGPGGLFAALRLIELGVKPIVLERGKEVMERRVDASRIQREGIVDPESNYCFGEGGAGAYSDGDAHPHIGSDKLPGVIKAMRETILRCGGEVHFQTRVTRLIVENGKVTGVETAGGENFSGPVILATGHSARDVYKMLYDSDITVEAKGIAVGVRLEHPQRIIDQIQYHSVLGRGEYLPAAEYNFVTQVDHRGVYSFCMCPGGFVVPAVSEPDGLVVNGMSPSNRGSHWANSGMVVELHPEDLPDRYKKYGVLSMMNFQRDMEQRAYAEAGNSLIAGAQRMKDFVDGKSSRNIPPSSYLPGVQPSRLDQWMPPFVANRLRKGFQVFGKNARGFLTNDAAVIGVETRTSSPLRIPRNLELMHHVTFEGLYPCGEGAGYAGGIVSSAIDGERCAEALARAFEC